MSGRVVRTVLAVLAALGAMSAVPALGETTVSDFLASYDAAKGDDRVIYEVAASSVENGLGWANAYMKREHPDSMMYCAPQTLSQSGEGVIAILRKFVGTHPDAGDKPYGMIILFAEMAEYPCQDQSKPTY